MISNHYPPPDTAKDSKNFKEGIHYFLLQGESLKQFRLQVNDIDLQISPMTRFQKWSKKGLPKIGESKKRRNLWN